MNLATRRITEGAMMCALVGAMLFINRQLGGMLEYIMYWVFTFPILIYTAKYGVRAGLLPTASMLLLSFMLAAPTTIFYLCSSLVVGLVYGAGIRKKWKNGWLLFWTMLFTFVSYLITTVFLAALFGYDPGEDVEMVTMLIEFLHVNTLLNITTLVMIVVLLSALLMSVLQTICIHVLANTMMSRLKIECHSMKNIFELCLPKWCAYIIIIIWILFSGRNVIKLNQDMLSYLIGIYMAVRVVAIAYGVLVLLCLSVALRHRILAVVICVGMFLPYIQGAIAFTGVADMLFGLRTTFLTKWKRGVRYGSSGKF